MRLVLEIEMTVFANGIRCMGEGTERSGFWLEQEMWKTRVRTGLGRIIKKVWFGTCVCNVLSSLGGEVDRGVGSTEYGGRG